eukprot:TRINITY_DN67832_c5_g2_i1.p1 TRINITY_DN67832_c5_g2~~TRINITY_DN67832_c5_g2_i1.p1  ORF type:complete len:207 (+),score=23.93 TRINITY_DN67832_c5_g2_i1:39-659(+)
MALSKAPRFGHGGMYDVEPNQQYGESIPNIKKIILSDDALEKSVSRLSQQKKYKIEDGPILPPIVRGKGEIEQQVDRLYTQSVKAQEEKLARLQRAQELPVKKLSTDEMDDAVQRLYTWSKEAIVQKTKQRYLADPKYKTHEPKKIPKSKITANTTRMYMDSVKQREEREKRLYEKYILATEPPKKILPKDTISQSADRLFRNASD